MHLLRQVVGRDHSSGEEHGDPARRQSIGTLLHGDLWRAALL